MVIDYNTFRPLTITPKLDLFQGQTTISLFGISHESI